MLLDHTFRTSESDDSVEGRYANFFKIGHNAHEFVIDCGQHYSRETARAMLHTRIITSPAYAKALLATLMNALDQYEQVYGSVEG